jgi:hypothetical protein
MRSIMKQRLVTYWSLRKNPGPFKILVILLSVMVCGNAWALDEFQGLKCGTDIPKFLIGKRTSNERVVVLEQRHIDLGLKDLGGTYVARDDRLFLISWQICGNEYELLVNLNNGTAKNGLILDVLRFPPHSATSPMFIGTCQADGKKTPETIVAVLNNSAGHNAKAKIMLKATVSWRIDETKEKFAKQPAETLECPLDRIITLDGGP